MSDNDKVSEVLEKLNEEYSKLLNDFKDSIPVENQELILTSIFTHAEKVYKMIDLQKEIGHYEKMKIRIWYIG